MGIFDRFRPDRDPTPPLQPKGESGRGHYDGFLDLEELNNDLRGPTGLRVYDEMYRTDGDVRQVVGLVCNPALSGTWQVMPFGGDDATDEDEKHAKVVKWALLERMSPNLMGHLAEAMPVVVRSGFAPFEKVWMHDKLDGEDFLIPRSLQLRLPRTIYRWETDPATGELTALVQFSWSSHDSVTEYDVDARSGGPGMVGGSGAQTGNIGGGKGFRYVTLPMRDVVYYRVGNEGDNWEGVSMLRPAYKHWKLKDAIERIDAIAQEREAVGIPICYPPSGATPDQLDAMEEILANMHSNEQGYIVAPGPHAQDVQDGNQGWRIDLMGFDRTGSGRDPQPSLDYHTNKIAAAFISEFMRLGHSNVGARATAQVQANPFMDSVEAIVGMVESVVNEQLVEDIMAYNFPDAKGAPLVKMSLVDSSSLTQVADFVSKLVMVGALMPDQKLENFLRDRAELPQADPKSVQARGSSVTDAEKRKEVIIGSDPGQLGTSGDGSGVGGGNRNKGGFGAHAPPGLPHGAKAVPAREAKSASLDAADIEETTTLDAVDYPFDPGTGAASSRPRRRPLRDDERHIALDDIEARVASAPDRLQAALREDVMRASRLIAGRRGHRRPPDGLVQRLRQEFGSMYDYGHQTVADEAQRQAVARGAAYEPPPRMHATAPDDDQRQLDQRAEHAAEEIHGDIVRARRRHHVGPDSEATRQANAEQAGQAAVKRVAQEHTMSVFNMGRTLAADQNPDLIAARYTSILDASTCKPCEQSDDGQLRPLDDPVRMDRRPPNHHCLSTLSGRNMCRCFETYELAPPPGADGGATLDASQVPNDPAKTNWVEKRGGLPHFIADIAGDLITERGMTVERAIATAVNKCKEWAAGGDHVTPATQAKASAAVAEWEAKKAG